MNMITVCHEIEPKKWKYKKNCICLYCYDHEEITIGAGGMNLREL